MQAYSQVFGGDIKGGITTQTGYTSKPGVQAPTKYDEFFQKAANTYNISADLLKAVASVESSFNPALTSPKGAQGIMQIMPETAKSLGLKDAYDPETSILASANLLAGLFKKYNGNLELALAAYNAGEPAVDRYKGVPPYDETQKYIPKIMSRLDATAQAIPGLSISDIVAIKIENEIDKMFNTGAFTKDDQGRAAAGKYRQARTFEEDQKIKAPTMTFYDQLFALSGKTSEAFWTNETAKYEQAIKTMGDLATDEEKNMFRSRSAFQQYLRKIEPQRKALEAVQASTGQAPEMLLEIQRKELLEQQRTERNQEWAKTAEAELLLDRKHAIELRKLEMLGYQGRLDAAKDFFDNTGILTENYQALELKSFEDQHKNLIATGRYDEEELKKLYEYRLENLRKSFIEPAKKDLEELQRVTGVMTPQLYSWSTADVDDQAKRMKNKGAPEELVDEWQRRQYLAMNADMLESNKNFFDASQAAWLRYQSQQKTISQEISETWLSMFGSLEGEWRQGFFDVFTGDMSKLGDVAKNTGKIIQRALSDISFSILKDQMMEMGKTGLPALKDMFSTGSGLLSGMFGNKEKTAGIGDTEDWSDLYEKKDGITESDLPNDAWPSETRFLDKFKEMTGLGAEKARETALMNVSAQVVNVNGGATGGSIPSLLGGAADWISSGIGTNTVNDKGEAYSGWGGRTGDWPEEPKIDETVGGFDEPVPVELEAENFLNGLGERFDDFFARMTGGSGKSNEYDGGGTGWWTTAGKLLGLAKGIYSGNASGINDLFKGSPNSSPQGNPYGARTGDWEGNGASGGPQLDEWDYQKRGGAYGAMGRYAFAKGDVFNTPTYFKFAKGLGVMGEAGPEAILPLQRDAQGKLGVAGGTSITVPVTIEGEQGITPAKETKLRREIESVCRDFVQREMR